MNYNAVFERLAATSSRNEKEEILTEYVNDELFCSILRHALDPTYLYYIKKIPKYTPANVQILSVYDAMIELHALRTRSRTGNDAIEHLTWILNRMTADDAKVIERIIKKDLNCGVQVSTINKVWPGLIFDHKVMLAEPATEKLLAKLKWPQIQQLKSDGMRVNFIVNGQSVTALTRNGKNIDLHGVFDEFFLRMQEALPNPNVAYVFDGELAIRSKNGAILPRAEGNGIINKGVKGTISPEEAAAIVVFLWDAFPAYLMDDPGAPGNLPCRSRLRELKNTLSKVLDPEHRVKVIQTKEVHSLEEAFTFNKEVIDAGGEGTMLKDPEEPWEPKRVSHQLKLKKVLEADLLCVGWEEGTKKNQGKMGALVLQTSDGIVKVNVGTGFNDVQRLWKPEDVVGKIVAINYFDVIKDKRTEQWSLYLPVFIEIRVDKDQADSFESLYSAAQNKLE